MKDQTPSMTAPGSETVLTFKSPPEPGKIGLAAHVAEAGEPFVSFFTVEEMETELKCCGFSQLSFLTPDEAKAIYFTPPRRDLPPPRQTNIVMASV
jgi:hypothetical protein